ncbi:hypothetical protein B7494_g4742 [Chlorociboria aeruginascens]|nr:hypothetical protein B7494_g4742 [Chlorociboria aeruginascens]
MSEIEAEESLQFQDDQCILSTMEEVFQYRVKRGRYQRAWSLFDSNKGSTDFRNPFLEDRHPKDRGSCLGGNRWDTAEYVGTDDDERILRETFFKPSKWDAPEFVRVDDDLEDTFLRADGLDMPPCCMGSDSEPPNSLSSSSSDNYVQLSSTPSNSISDHKNYFLYFSQLVGSRQDDSLQYSKDAPAAEPFSTLDVEALVEDSQSDSYRFVDRDGEKRHFSVIHDLSPHPPKVGCYCYHCRAVRYLDPSMRTHDPSVWCFCRHCQHTRNPLFFCYCQLCRPIPIREKRGEEMEQSRYEYIPSLQSPSYGSSQKRKENTKKSLFRCIKAYLRTGCDSDSDGDSDSDDEDIYLM